MAIISKLMRRASEVHTDKGIRHHRLDIVRANYAEDATGYAIRWILDRKPRVSGVVLVVDGEERGSVDREALEEVIAAGVGTVAWSAFGSDAAIGRADGLLLPGESDLKIFVYRCPVARCPTRQYQIRVDPAEPLRCPRHPTKTLVLQRSRR